MAIRTFNSVGGFSVGEVPVQVIDNTGNIANVDKAVISNVTASTKLVAGNITSNNLSNTQVTFTKDGVLSDSANLTFTGGNVFTIKDAANITDGTNYISITGTNGGIKSTGNANLANGAFTITTDGDAAIANSLTVGSNGQNSDSAFYVDAAGNFSIKIANTSAPGGFTTVFSVDAASGNITTAGSVVSPTGGSATITAPGSNTQILFNDNGNVNASSGLRYYSGDSSVEIDGNVTVYSNINLDNGNITGASQVVLTNGGKIYDDGSNSIVMHSENGGYAQLEYLPNGGSGTSSYVWVQDNGAFIEQGAAQISTSNDNGITLSYDGSSYVYANSSGTKITTNNGGVYFDARNNGSAYIGSNGAEWVFDTENALTTPGDINVGGSIYANAGGLQVAYLANVGSLSVTGSADMLSDANVAGDLTVTSDSFLKGHVTVGVVSGPTSDLVVSGDTHLYGDLEVDGVANLYNLHVENHVTSDLIPDIDADGSGAGYDLGSSSYRWKDLWLSGFTINLGNTQISSGGSNNMIVGNAVVGYNGSTSIGNYTPVTGNLYAGYFTTSHDAVIGDSTHKANLTVYGVSNVANTTVASSTTTGAFVVAGGVGVGGNIYVGANANIAGNVLIQGANVDISNGNLHVQANANVHGDMLIGGNLTVSGTTTYVNTTNSSIKDTLIDIGGADNGADLAGGDAYDRGLYIHNYTGGAVVNQFMGWKQSDSEFQLKSGVTTSGNAVSGGNYANVRVDHLFGTIGTTTQDEIQNMGGLVTIDVTDYANITGTANINTAILADLTLGELHFTNLDVAGPNDNEVVVLRTDGAGEVSFEVIHTDRIGNASSGIFVNQNGNVEVTANENLVFTVTDVGANVAGDLDVTGLLSAGSLNVGVLTPQSITLGDTSIQDETTTVTNTTATVVARAAVDVGGAVEFFVKGIATVGGVKKVTVATITALYDGTSVDFATYGKLHMGGGAGTFDVNYASGTGGGLGNIQLVATNTNSADTVWTAQIRTI